MRIAWTGPVGDGGGVPTMGLLILRELLREGVEVDLYVPRYEFEPLPIEPAPGLRVIERRSNWKWGQWYSRTKAGALFSGTASRTLSHLILNVRLLVEHRRRPYDVVYQLSTTELFLLGRLRRWAPPIVVHPCTHVAGELRAHRAEARYALQVEPWSTHMVMRAWLSLRAKGQPAELARADRVLGLSERFNELLREDYGVPADKLGVVRTPVDLNRFTAEGETERQERRLLLFVSRISVRKGVDDIIELSHRLDDLADSIHLVVVGGATQWSDYTGHLKRLNPRIASYVGSVRTHELPKLMRGASILLVPSTYEPGSIATAEALACGLPVVLSDEVGNSEVTAGPHARIHRAGDLDDLEEAVRSLLATSDETQTLRTSARQNAEDAFSPAGVVRALLAELAVAVGMDAPERQGEQADLAQLSHAELAPQP